MKREAGGRESESYSESENERSGRARVKEERMLGREGRDLSERKRARARKRRSTDSSVNYETNSGLGRET